MRFFAFILAGVLSFSMLAAQTRMAGPKTSFGQICIMSTVTGVINGQPVSGVGYGMLDTTGQFPSQYDVNYESVPGSIIPITLFPCQLEAESGALNLWQLSGGQFTCRQTYRWPSYPGDSVIRVIHSTVVGCTLVVHDSLFGQISDPTGPGEIPYYAAHWTQVDSATVAEQCTLGYVTTGGDTLLTTISSRFTGLRQQLPAPEVSKAYFPSGSYSSNHSSITWWGRTMPENHGRQMDFTEDIGGIINGESLSGRAWGALDTTGEKSAYNYLYFDSIAIPPLPLVWFDATGITFNGVPVSLPRVLNLWELSGGHYDVSRSGLLSQDPADTFVMTAAVRRTGLALHATIQISGRYSGPTDLVHLQSEQALWHQLDSATMSDTCRASVLRSNGDSVVATFRSTFQNLRRSLNFDQTGFVVFPQSRAASDCVAYTWTGMLDSATTGVVEKRVVSDLVQTGPQVWPTPCKEVATISFDLPKAGITSLRLFDATGRLVSTIAQGHMPAGRYSVSLASLGEELRGGIHIARLETAGFSKTVKLVLSPRR